MNKDRGMSNSHAKLVRLAKWLATKREMKFFFALYFRFKRFLAFRRWISRILIEKTN